MSYITTISGRKFHFGDHAAMVEAIDIGDIAHALGNLCRFTGQSSEFYSVAEHSYHLSRIVAPELALVGLLHDATEAYCADIARPLKMMLPDYREVEDQIWLAIAEKFGLPASMPSEIKDADMAMLKLEVTKVLPPEAAADLNLPGPASPSILHYWNPKYAKYAFLKQYYLLTE